MDEILELQHKIIKLKRENDQLKGKILELSEYSSECDRHAKIWGKQQLRGGYTGRMRNLPDFNERWSKTVFWKYRDDINRFNFQPLDIIEKILQNFRDQKDNILGMFACNIIAYCEMAVPTKKGPVFHLIDPFAEKEILVSNVCFDEISKHVGRIVYLSCLEKPKTGKLQIVKMERLSYTLYEKLQEE